MPRHTGGTVAASGIAKSYGAQPVLEDVSLSVSPGDRIGIVGPNGIGKSTLMRILAGVEQPDAGSVARHPASTSVGYLPQERERAAEEIVLGYLARRTEVAPAEAEMEALAARLADDHGLADAYAEALDRFLARGGADLPARARGVLAELGVEVELEAPLGSLSGGEAARVALASIMLTQLDVLLLDEPTNDLDFDGLDRLEGFLAGFPGGAAIVSHDRDFLDRTVTRVLELEEGTRRAGEYVGGWSDYEAERRRRGELRAAQYGRYAEERRRREDALRRRQAQATAAGRMTNRRLTRAFESQTRAAERALERLEPVEKPWEPWELHLTLAPERRSGDVVAQLERAVVEQDGFRLGPVDLDIRFGDRITIVGPNGSGKTTLLNALLGVLPLTRGRRRLGRSVVTGELDQGRAGFTTDEPVLDSFLRQSGWPAEEARTLLAKFGLGVDDVLRPGSSLSPGERTRAALSLLVACGVNLLVLDEPTNHLDLPAIEELESALDRYEATVLLVTHDRRFLERFRATRTLDVVAGTVREA